MQKKKKERNKKRKRRRSDWLGTRRDRRGRKIKEIGNSTNFGLSFYTTEKALLDAFSQYGQAVEANVLMDKVSSRSKGFKFVTYASVEESEKAISEMDGKTLHGRIITVELAKPQTKHTGGMSLARGPPDPHTEKQ
ncbi:small RNA-binding protein 11, chloroplastic-like [Helianthus annuus]|uniref:small RNA-binding protein 11, chloroplastic-like n=1 Tax=Helianthus annuus TaxID=4232 RepID=UPI0016532971|nr:small RNA-binding protein 11, chloroplastic-like [Helianthus annuus]